MDKVTTLGQNFHEEALGDSNHCCLNKAQVPDGPAARRELHLWIKIRLENFNLDIFGVNLSFT
jgi:hypothetical protein